MYYDRDLKSSQIILLREISDISFDKLKDLLYITLNLLHEIVDLYKNRYNVKDPTLLPMDYDDIFNVTYGDMIKLCEKNARAKSYYC